MLDLATSTVAFGKVRVAHNKGEKVPHGWVIDDAGAPTDDPSPMALNRSGALTTFGQHKGSGLAIFVELLAGAIAGTETVARGTQLPNGVFNNMFSILIDPTAFDSQTEIEARVLEFYESIKSSKPASGVNKVLLPGEPEIICQKQREVEGIYVDPETIDQLMQTCQNFTLNVAEAQSILQTADQGW